MGSGQVISRDDAVLLGDGELDALISEAVRAVEVATANLHVLTAVHGERRLLEQQGHANEAQYLAAQGVDPKDARRLTHHGRVLARHPHVAAAVADGVLHADRLALLLKVAVGRTAAAFLVDEEDLVTRVVAAPSLRAAEQVVADWRERVTADGSPPPDGEDDRVDLSQVFDSVLGQFRLSGEKAEQFVEELDRLTDRIEKADKTAGVQRSRAARRADALALMAERSAGDRTPTRPLVALILTHEEWVAHAGATLIRTGFHVSHQTVERNLCTSRLCRIVMDATGRVIDLGRESRCNSDDQRLARIIRDRTCVFGDCDVPAADCHGHHAHREWQAGGLTDLDQIGSVCSGHHRLVHEGGWTIRHQPDGAWTATSPTGLTLTRPPPQPDG